MACRYIVRDIRQITIYFRDGEAVTFDTTDFDASLVENEKEIALTFGCSELPCFFGKLTGGRHNAIIKTPNGDYILQGIRCKSFDRPTKDEWTWKYTIDAYSTVSSMAEIEYYLRINPNYAIFAWDEEGEYEVSVECNTDWHVTSYPDWVNVTVGDDSITVSADNNTGEARTGYVELETVNGLAGVSLYVEQEKSPYSSITVIPSSINAPSSATFVNVQVKCDGSWNAASPVEWITLGTTEGTGDGTVRVAISANTGAERSAIIAFGSGPNSASVVVNQAAKQGTISINVGDPIPATGGSTTIMVTCSGAWTLEASDTLELSQRSGFGNKMVIATLPAWTASGERTFTVTAKSGSNTDTGTVIQEGSQYIILSPSQSSIGGDGGTINLYVSSNAGSWYLTSWLATFNPSSGSGSRNVVMTIPANTSSSEREILVTGTTIGGITDSIVITQTAEGGFSVDPDYYVIDYDDTSDNTSDVTSSYPFSVKSCPDWITADYDSSSVTFSCSVNDTGAERSGFIVLSNSAHEEVSISVIQNAEPYLRLDGPEVSFDEHGGMEIIQVDSNVPWSLSVSVSDGEENVTVLPVSGTGSKNVMLNVGPTDQDRTITILASSSLYSVTDMLQYQQLQGYRRIEVDPSVINVGSEATVETFTLSSDVDWTSTSIISLSKSYGTQGEYEIEAFIPKNFTTDAKIYTVNFYYAEDTSRVAATLTINQEAADEPYINVSPTTLTFDEEGGSQEVSVDSNVIWVVSVSGDTEYFTVFPTDGYGDGTVTIDALPMDEDDDDRTITLDFYDYNDMYTPKASVTVNQIYDRMNYLYFTSENDFSVGMNYSDQFTFHAPELIEYSYDQSEWHTFDGNYVECDGGGRIYFRGVVRDRGGKPGLINHRFVFEGEDIYCHGNLMTLSNYQNISDVVRRHEFGGIYSLFGHSTELVSAPYISATSYEEGACEGMYYGCTKLAVAPAINATSLGTSACESMFGGCTSLVEVPEIMTTSFGNSACKNMFKNCTSLVTAPVIHFGGVDEYSFWGMFEGCSSLTNVPFSIENVDGLNGGESFTDMFKDCTSLVFAPKIDFKTSAPFYVDYMCSSMFMGCSSLKYINAYFRKYDVRTYHATNCWVSGVPNKGVFVTDYPNDWDYGINEVPFGWKKFRDDVDFIELLDDDLASFYDNGGTKTIQVFSNTKWRAVLNGSTDRISVYPLEGEGNCEITINVDEMSEEDENSYSTVELYAEDDMETPLQEIEIWQRREIEHYIKFSVVNESEFGPDETFTIKTIDSSTHHDKSISELEWSADGYVWESGISGMTVYVNENIYVRGKLPTDARPNMQFSINGKLDTGKRVRCDGDLMSLIDYEEKVEIMPNVDSYFGALFTDNLDLVSGPSLTALRLSNYCYANFYWGCSNLTSAPELPAMRIKANCYANLFRNCTSLTSAPALPSLKLENSCYSGLFYGCTSLTSAPSLPSKVLTDNCYNEMFRECSSLVIGPEISAISINSSIYSPCDYMFFDCSSLIYAKCMIISDSDGFSFVNWMHGVSSTGTFVKNPEMTKWSRGEWGIPQGWTVI